MAMKNKLRLKHWNLRPMNFGFQNAPQIKYRKPDYFPDAESRRIALIVIKYMFDLDHFVNVRRRHNKLFNRAWRGIAGVGPIERYVGSTAPSCQAFAMFVVQRDLPPCVCVRFLRPGR